MPSSVEKIDLYEITVDPHVGPTWRGLFNFHPDANDVAAAMRVTISELDEDVEHEYDLIQQWRRTLELVTFHTPELLGEVKIAGTYVGEISMAIIKVFTLSKSRVPQFSDTSAVPNGNPCGEIPLAATEDHGENF
jgi:hypothetical protein